jgi:hypothetical protein
MRAIRVHESGGIDTMRLDEIPRPVPEAGEVLVVVKAAGVGPWDRLVREGQSGLGQALPLTLGSDISGTVAALGVGVGVFALGDAVYGATNDQFVGGYAEYALVEANKVALNPPRSTTSQRRAFRSSPLPRGRCCSSTRVSKRGRRSWCAVRRAASAPARRRWRRKSAPASTEPRAPGTSNGFGRWVPSRSWKAIALARNWPPGPSMLLSTPSAVTHSKAPARRCARTGSSSPSCAPRTRPMSGREACARRISSSTSRATGSTGSRRWSNAERLTCRSARFSTSQTRAPPTACWMARPTSPERSCSRSQTDRGGPWLNVQKS